MKSFLRLGLAVVSLALFFNAIAVTEAKAQLFEILKRMDAHQKSLVSLRSKITMVKYNSQLKESDGNEGTAIYFRGLDKKVSARIDWTKPLQETVAVINNQYVIYRPRLRQAITGKISENNQASSPFSFLTMTKREITANFTIKYLSNEVVGGTETVLLEFTPRRPTIYKSAELWIDKNGMPIKVKVLENNSDTTTVLLSERQENVTIKGEEFKVRLSKGTKFIYDGISFCANSPNNVDDALKEHSDAVFSGKIIAVKGSDYTFKTEKVWKGTVKSREIVRSLPTGRNSAIILAANESYVVFAQNVQTADKTVLSITPCNFTSNLLSVSGKKILTKLGEGKPVSKPLPNKKTPVRRFSKRPPRKRA